MSLLLLGSIAYDHLKTPVSAVAYSQIVGFVGAALNENVNKINKLLPKVLNMPADLVNISARKQQLKKYMGL
ncbi:MAG TPA: hypothetical protein PL063_04460 [Candidatus Cloacimonadota bacterium]|jgi:hypothetical protein|nr:hypothetical protein [Candidatus Cloacimonadales bacterium]HPY96441.1 hypothetical protein [Candidatus Cloacimonadota bacterium]HQB41858.1 hypothetical protein [Candidatus Cloacimonadota bacterium]